MSTAETLPEPACDYCDEGNQERAGWHYVADEDDPTGAFRVPCPRADAPGTA